ncbi:MAG: methyltransferase domain-containing protein [Acidobacteria bacterium]|nr:methyltransferase domain-containing protein [Acidobacteriota bacterium]
MARLFSYSLAFDREAKVYDEGFNALASTQALRARIWRELRAIFPPGSLVLDIGCGTGQDAGALAEHGVEVVAIDVSPAMIERAKAKHDGKPASPVFGVCDVRDAADHLPRLLDQGGRHARTIDGIVSNFGALNCLASLEPITRLADQYVRPGGVLVLVLINRWYLRELARFELRRLRPNGSPVRCGGHEIPLFYHPPRALRWPGYSLTRVMALASFSRSDVQTRWPLNRLGDHYLAVLRKDGGRRPFHRLTTASGVPRPRTEPASTRRTHSAIRRRSAASWVT